MREAWADVPADVTSRFEASRGPAAVLADELDGFWPAAHVDFLYDPTTKSSHWQADGLTGGDCAVATRLSRLVGAPSLSSVVTLGGFVKLAEAGPLSTLGQWLNFLPGHYPGGWPNHPTPLASMLASSLLGAGLGYGAGRVGRWLLPAGYGENLGRTGAMLGGLAGLGAGSIPAIVNLTNDKHWNAPEALGRPGDMPELDKRFMFGSDVELPYRLKNDSAYKSGAVKAAVSANGGSWFMPNEPMGHSPTDVHIDSLGRTLWASQLQPRDVSTAFGTMYTAQLMPTVRGHSEEWVGGDQLGSLALAAGGDYLKGMLAGAAINAIVGTPFSAPAIGAANAAAGVIMTVIPRLFGRG